MKTQREHITAAKCAYIMPLCQPRGDKGCRYAIYLADATGRMNVLWPGDGERDLLPHQVCYRGHASGAELYPPFHFRPGDYGVYGITSLTAMLVAINSDVKVFSLGGYQPSPQDYF